MVFSSKYFVFDLVVIDILWYYKIIPYNDYYSRIFTFPLLFIAHLFLFFDCPCFYPLRGEVSGVGLGVGTGVVLGVGSGVDAEKSASLENLSVPSGKISIL